MNSISSRRLFSKNKIKTIFLTWLTFFMAFLYLRKGWSQKKFRRENLLSKTKIPFRTKLSSMKQYWKKYASLLLENCHDLREIPVRSKRISKKIFLHACKLETQIGQFCHLTWLHGIRISATMRRRQVTFCFFYYFL